MCGDGLGVAMLNTYYTYRALSAEWNSLLTADSVAAIYFRYFFRSDRSGRPRRNVAELMAGAAGSRIVEVRIAERDRVLMIDLAGGEELHYHLYGSRPNLFLVREGRVIDAFKDARRYRDQPVPEPRPAGRCSDEDDFQARARDEKTALKAIARAFPLFDRVLATEVLHRAGLEADASVEQALEHGVKLYDTALEVEREVGAARAARIYRTRDGEIFLSLIELDHLAGCEHSEFDGVDAAVTACTRMIFRHMQFEEKIGPIRQSLGDQLQRVERRVREVSEHVGRPGRADDLERYGHLLMASGRGEEVGLQAIEIPDHFGTREPVEIPLDPALSVLANAQRYYDRARRSRMARDSAKERVAQARASLDSLQQAAAELEAVVDIDGLKDFQRANEDLLGGSSEGGHSAPRPFRRYALGDGFEVWVGRNAKENDELTFGHARKFDIWMHARGVGGSHALLRLPGRTATPGSVVIEKAASVAAYYSKARGSELVPVMYTERKYVRKPRGADPGKVVVEREEVVIVKPALPGT